MLMCPRKVLAHSPLPESHILTQLSADPDAIHRESGDQLTDSTASVCPVNVFIHSPLCAFHILMELSMDPDTIHRESGDQSTDMTANACPVIVFAHVPACAFHILMDLSLDPDTIQRESGDHLAELTRSVCPFSVLAHMPLPYRISHILTERSSDPDASHRESDDHCTELTRSVCSIRTPTFFHPEPDMLLRDDDQWKRCNEKQESVMVHIISRLCGGSQPAHSLSDSLAITAAMSVDLVVGGAFGDEGKGRIVAAVAVRRNAKVVARGAGGSNSGHTIVFDGKTYGIRQVPSAVLDVPAAKLVIGAGVVVDPEVFAKEVDLLKLDPTRVVVDRNCGVITPECRERERANAHLMKTVGSTGSGTGAATSDRVMRCGIIARDCDALQPYVGKVSTIIHDCVNRGETVVVEGTQATFLSLYHGEYPYVTSKDVTAAQLCADCGIGPKAVRDVFIVFKAYWTRVGAGELEGEITREEAEKRGWQEFGVVTGRPRRACPFNVVLAREAIALNSANYMCITKLDVLFPECKGVTDPLKLSPAALEWIRTKERECGIPAYCVGTGPDAKETVFFFDC